MSIPTNHKIANILDEIADLLEVQHANVHRVRAYRNAAQYVRKLSKPIAELISPDDPHALQALPFIGERLAKLIEEVVQLGKSSLLERLKGSVNPEEIFEKLPGVGPTLASRIVHDLDIDTLEELEAAAHDGRLTKVQGMGKRRIEGLRWSLAGRLSRYGGTGSPINQIKNHRSPDVQDLLQVDFVYRHKSSEGKLRKIAPKRFNPAGDAWLPIMHTDFNDWSYTVLYSNSARAHQLEKTRDWVVIYYEKADVHGQATVVTETRGNLSGHRVVRGREHECAAHYAHHATASH
ncbi:MAG: hypothetical protein KDC57_03380 [Saprospiraceae bacterium]|nr:hypothetical protein [Saprospiraceae bacterium]